MEADMGRLPAAFLFSGSILRRSRRREARNFWKRQ
jgi:hypothetical protein